MSPFRFAVLECDTPLPAVLEKEGDYGTIFEAFIRRGLESYIANGGEKKVDLEVIKSNMVDMGELPELDKIDALILTGSRHNAFDDNEWIVRLVDYVRNIYQTTQIPIVGICFGHQIIAQNLGDSPVCSIQGMLIPGRVLSVQGHPEFSQFIMNTILEARHGQKIFSDELYESGVQRA
ncbi:Glutamine amidotransferase class-I, partial [Geosmithia morbida]